MIREKLENAHRKFLDSINNYVIGEFLVGSLVYAPEGNLSERSDLDIVCIVENGKLKDFLESKHLNGLIKYDIAYDVLKNKISDYLVLKLYIDGVLLSVDIISPNFFKKICGCNLKESKRSFKSYKFGNEPQMNQYESTEFIGETHYIQKKDLEYSGGHSIELPLFFIFGDKYSPGIPSIKYITNKIFIDTKNFISENIDDLYSNIIERLIYEYPNQSNETYTQYFFNILKGKEKYPKEYKEIIKNKVLSIIDMKKKIDLIRDEVYSLFKEDKGEKKYLYVRRDWIFPNHFDVMIDLVKDMCGKYGGDFDICKIASLLHDTGLVYGRESASPAGHEERSIDYALKIMTKYEFSDEIKNEVVECIRATDAKENPTGTNQKIVRTADALSQFISVHFFAKAAFSGDWEFYSEWLEKKATNNFKKICFEDEKKIALPIRDYIINAVELYKKHNNKNEN